MDNINHFLEAFKYLEKENHSPLENYTTELLVLILCYLNSNEDKFSQINNKIASLFVLSLDDYKKVKFETQKKYEKLTCKLKDKTYLIPDISISINNTLHTLIEVKIDQELQEYTTENNDTKNQLEVYSSIENVEKVILLSKFDYESSKKNNNEKIKYIRWHQLYEILESLKGKDYIVSSFLNFMDANDIGKQKTITTENNITNILEFIDAFYSLLHDAWKQANIKEFYLSENTYAYKWGLGFYIKKTGEKDGSGETDYFLGINQYENVRNKISFWCKKSIGNEDTFEKVYNGFVTQNNLDLSELCKQEADKQIKKLSEWIKSNIKPILEKELQEGAN